MCKTGPLFRACDVTPCVTVHPVAGDGDELEAVSRPSWAAEFGRVTQFRGWAAKRQINSLFFRRDNLRGRERSGTCE